MPVISIKTKLILIVLLIFLLGVLFIVDFIGSVCPLSLVAQSVDQPIVVTRKNDLLLTQISQIVSDENRIYVLFGTYSVVQAYTHEGEYLYTVSVYNHANGRTKIAAQDNRLYIKDKVGDIYIFSGDCFVERFDRDKQTDLATVGSFGASDPAYSVRLGSVWEAKTNDSARCVIQRPAILAIYQNNTLFLLKFIFMMIIGLLLVFRGGAALRRRNSENR